MRRAGCVGEDLRPAGPRYLADVNIAAGVYGEAMWGEKLAELRPCWCLAETTDQLALVVNDADARPKIWDVAADRGRRADLADIEDRLVAVRHAEAAGAMQVLPLRLVFAATVEYLDAVVLAIGDIDPAVGVAADVVDDVELAFASAGRAPRHKSLPSGEYL